MVNILLGETLWPVPSSNRDEFWAANQTLFLQALAAAVNAAPVVYDPGTWTTIGLQSGWSGTVQYRLDSNAQVFFRGSAAHSGSSTSLVLSIPTEARIPVAAYFGATLGTDGQMATLLILADGSTTVYFIPAGGNTVNGVYFDQISYSTVA